ncbi:hypothetical protein BJF90_44265 [Pseudonocardia sp. CNS-004]|nr:hypothetical protein BJF90_44265 [Pseudonocardia sp. CNS-004]
MPNSDLRRQARQAYADSLAAGAGVSGKALGERFGRSERWGRERIAEVRVTVPPLDQRHSADGNGAEPAAADDGDRQQHGVTTVDALVPAVPSGARFVAWLGFVFGSVMSVAANVLHAWLPADERPAGWSPGIAPQVGSAVWPIGLLLSVEVLSRVPWAPGFWWALARYGGAGTVALGSAVISYGHLREVLIAWDYGALGAAVGPLVLDGLMVVSGFALLTVSRTRAGTAGSATTDLAAEVGVADE